MKYTFASATLSVALAEIPSNENLATYGLTLDEYGLMKASESPYDFGGIEDEDQQQLWLDAAAFSYEVAAVAAESGSSSMSFMPYVVCSSFPDMSGAQRLQQVNFTFANTTGVSTTDFYLYEAAVINVENITCGMISAHNDTVALVYAGNPGAEEWLAVQPHHQSMKMNNSTVAIFEERFADIESGDYELSSDKSGWFKYINVLGTSSLLCPGVQNFGGEDVPDDEIVDSIKNFITEDDGGQIKAASFFHDRVNGDSSGGVQTDRMTYWAGLITEVDGMAKEDGTNYCRHDVLRDNFSYRIDMDTLSVHAKINTDELLKLAKDDGFVQNDLEKCLMYLVMGLALNPMICWTEPQSYVETLCPDGSSDLTACPEPETEIPGSSSKYIDGTFGSTVSFCSLLAVWFSL